MPPANFVEPRKVFYGLLQCLWEHQLEKLDQLDQPDQWLSPSELLKGEKVLSHCQYPSEILWIFRRLSLPQR
jgi:hypothetical protein